MLGAKSFLIGHTAVSCPAGKRAWMFRVLLCCFVILSLLSCEPTYSSSPRSTYKPPPPPANSRVSLSAGRHNFGYVSMEVPTGWDVSYTVGRYGWAKPVAQEDVLSGKLKPEGVWFNLLRSSENKQPGGGWVFCFMAEPAGQRSLKEFAESMCRKNSGILPVIQVGHDIWAFTIAQGGNSKVKVLVMRPYGSDIFITYQRYSKHLYAMEAENILLSVEEAR